MTNYYIFGGPSDLYGMGVRFTSLVAARKYAIKMLPHGDNRVNIYTKNDARWIIIPKSAIYGYVKYDKVLDAYYWHQDYRSQRLNLNGTIKRGY